VVGGESSAKQVQKGRTPIPIASLPTPPPLDFDAHHVFHHKPGADVDDSDGLFAALFGIALIDARRFLATTIFTLTRRRQRERATLHTVARDEQQQRLRGFDI
jgi:hypothetical protein